jgi:hypothetical protein
VGLIFVLLATALAAPLEGQDAQLAKLPALTDTRAAEAVRKALAPSGFRITLPDNTVDVWLAAFVPAGHNADSGATYDKFAESAFIGVISFAKDSKDYKGQRIAAGMYTMRYEIQPNNGDHLGTAPTRDFVLLMPITADLDPAAVMIYDQMVTLSKRASGTAHPLPLNLVAVEAKTFPSLSADEEGRTVFNARLGGSDIPIALVVRGTAPQ